MKEIKEQELTNEVNKENDHFFVAFVDEEGNESLQFDNMPKEDAERFVNFENYGFGLAGSNEFYFWGDQTDDGRIDGEESDKQVYNRLKTKSNEERKTESGD